jgi:peptidoglycan/LPS O-acetylase OafA/YrhL
MNPRERIAELDLLRFFAALSVMIYHLVTLPDPTTPAEQTIKWCARFGWMGVPLFFMISGFVILWTAQAKDGYAFVASRVSRLYPSFWAAVLLTSLITWGSFSPLTVAANLTMIPQRLGAPYVDGVYWTLDVEIMFYALVFILIVTHQMRRVELWLAIWAIVCAVGTFIPIPWITLSEQAPFFLSGCTLFLIRSRGPSRERLAILTVSLFLCLISGISQQKGFTKSDELSAHVVTATAIVLFHALFLGVALRRLRLPDLRLWYCLGSLTYPLYLVHNVIGKHIYARLPLTPWTKVAVVVACVLSLATVMAIVIEQRACSALQRFLLAKRPRILATPLGRPDS